jgi:hypothetical protein
MPETDSYGDFATEADRMVTLLGVLGDLGGY